MNPIDLNDERINEIFEKNLDDEFFNNGLKDSVADKLLRYQILHVQTLCFILKNKHNVVLDGSDTGTGKTYTSLAVCKELNLKPLVICPKSIMSTWHKIAKLFDIPLLGVVNYETIKKCKMYDMNKKRVPCPYIKYDNENNTFIWANNILIIFDEVHRCKDHKTLNGKLLMSSKEKNNKVLMLSATIIDKPEGFKIYGYMLGFYDQLKHANNWIKYIIRESTKKKTKNTNTNIIYFQEMNNRIYPERGSRMRISELGDQFPKNQVVAECYDLDKDVINEIEQMCQNIKKYKEQINNEKEESDEVKKHRFAEITEFRKKIELLKLPIIIDLTNDYLENGYSVAIFINFRKSMKILMDKLNTNCVIRGTQTIEERNDNIEDFQSNKARIIICNIQAGGQSISLHDIHGGHPRVSFINPSYSSINFVQCLGRTCRAGAKTPALQRIIYTTTKMESEICKTIQKKLKFMKNITDNDLCGINKQLKTSQNSNTANIKKVKK